MFSIYRKKQMLTEKHELPDSVGVCYNASSI